MRIFSIMSLVLLAACNGGSDYDTCEDTDTGTDSFVEKYATINVAATFLGIMVDCVVMVDGVLAGNTGEDIDITAEHTHTVGVGYENEFGLFVHILETWNGDSVWNGAGIVSPSWDVKLDPDAFADTDVEFNLYPVNANSYWSCSNDRNDSVATDIADTDGATFRMPGAGEMILTGINLELDSTMTGVFTSPSTATMAWVQSETSTINYTCCASDPDGTCL